MRFTFKMLVLVGLIVIGKFLKEEEAAGIVKNDTIRNEDVYSLKSITPLPFTHQTNHMIEPETKKEHTTNEKNFTYSLN